MKKILSSVSKKNKKQRGVAVIFTLGILGLLTVMALGFASTALLNNSLSKNVMNNAYARGLAKNLALTQAMYIISQKEIDSNGGLVDYRNIYTWGTDTNKDFLWKLDYTEAGVPGVQIYKYEPDQNTSDKPRYNPANNVRWQYVKDSTSPTNKIVGRYAYVVIPNKGSVDPSVNIGRDDEINNTTIKNCESRIPLGITVNNLSDAYNNTPNNFRWMTYLEMIKKSAISDASYSDWFQYNGIRPSLAMKSPEGFWKDDILYSRFNMNRSDWATMTVDKLCGIKSKSTSGSGTTYEYETLKEFPEEQTFIPWLQDMHKKSDPLKLQAHQIAANIIQYNLSADQPTVSDSADWLTDTPSYAGIGRHPMLNEIGFLIRVRTEVEYTTPTTTDETITCRYTPIFYITIDSAAELIYPFGQARNLKDSEINFSGIKDGSLDNLLLKFRLRKFLVDSSTELTNQVTNLGDSLIVDGVLSDQMLHGDHDIIAIQTTGEVNKLTPESSTVIHVMNNTNERFAWMGSNEKLQIFNDGSGGYKWSNSDLSLQCTSDPDTNGWSDSPAYTKAGKFWKEGQTGKQQTLKIPIRSFSMTTNKSVGSADSIAKAIARRMTIEFKTQGFKITPGKVVLKYDGIQRDLAQLDDVDLPDSMTDMSGMEPDNPNTGERVWFIAYETADPFVNLATTDWEHKESGVKKWNETTSLKNDYPGTCVKESGTEQHVNDPVKKILAPSSSDSAVKTLLTSYGYGEDGDPAYVDGVTRLPTSFIRHGQMLSFWELGCISRGKKFENLNLETKAGEPRSGYVPDFSRSFGDASLFDQLKFTDANYSEGKININTDVHKVLEQLFGYSGIAGKKMTFRKDICTSSGDDLLDAGEDDTASVKIQSQTLEQFKNRTPHDGDCLACKLAAITKSYPFQNRADLLLAAKDNLPGVLDANKNPIASATKPTDSAWAELRSLLLQGATYLEKIQLVSKLMPIMRAEPVDTLYVVILAQSIRDIGGNIPVLVDWDGTGIDAAISNTAKAMFKAGYRRTIDGAKIFSTEPTLSKTYTSNTIGTYDLGRDKITGETRLVATLVRDPVKRKWKLVRLQYVE